MLSGHTETINSMALDPLDKDKIATGSHDKSIKFWSISSASLLHSIDNAHTRRVYSLAYHNNNSPYLASGSIVADGIRLWNTVTYALAKTLAVHTEGSYILTLAFDPINKGILASGSNDKLLILSDFNAAAPFKVKTFPACTVVFCGIYGIVFEYTGLMASNEGSRYGNIVIWETDQTVKFRISAGDTSVDAFSLAFSPLASSRFLANGFYNGLIKLWDPTTGLQIGSDLTGHAEPVFSLAFRSDGWMASSSRSLEIKIWDMSTKTVKATLTGHTSRVMALGFNSDGVLASGSFDTNLILWS